MFKNLKLNHVFSIQKKILLLFSFIFIFSCEGPNTMKGTIGGKDPDSGDTVNKSNDFMNTEILVGDSVPADGSTTLVIVIHLKNSDNSSVAGIRPIYSLSSNNGVVANQCSTSDNNGVSVCTFKSTVPGTRIVTLTNTKIGLSANVVFTSPTATQKLEMIPACLPRGTTPQGSVVQVTAGNPFKGNQFQTPGGYKVTFSMQGVVQ